MFMFNVSGIEVEVYPLYMAFNKWVSFGTL